MKSLPVCLAAIYFVLSFVASAYSQKISPGYDADEFIELIKISAKCYDRDLTSGLAAPEKFTMAYRSPEMGLANAWEMWVSEDSIGVINIRPTVNNSISWLANVYAMMIPAKGTIKVADNKVFNYTLAGHPNAAVHLGFIIGLAFLSEDIMPVLESYYNQGIKDYYIIGHSQAGAISFLLTSYLHQLQKQDKLANDILFKTYCSGSPKPGNVYYAYEYECTRNGWAFNVINVDDWVPEAPFSVQTSNDFGNANPIELIQPFIKSQNLPKRMLFNMAFNSLDNPPKKVLKKYQKFLNKRIGRPIEKHLEGYEVPEFYPSFNYVRAGQPVILMGNEEYYKNFPIDKNNLMGHHSPKAYLYLVENTKKQR